MNVVMIYKYGKQFRFAPSFNKTFEIDFEIQNLLLFLPELSFDSIFKFNYILC